VESATNYLDFIGNWEGLQKCLSVMPVLVIKNVLEVKVLGSLI